MTVIKLQFIIHWHRYIAAYCTDTTQSDMAKTDNI